VPPGWPAGPRRVPNRRRRLPELLRAHDSMDTGAHIAGRFQRLKDLPEHPLFPHVHARLACGGSPWMVARWLQTVLPDGDRYSAASMPFMTLMHRLRRYAALLPPAARIPKSYLDGLVNGLPIQINVMADLAAAIVYQKQRIGQFAEDEKNLPMGMTHPVSTPGRDQGPVRFADRTRRQPDGTYRPPRLVGFADRALRRPLVTRAGPQPAMPRARSRRTPRGRARGRGR